VVVFFESGRLGNQLLQFVVLRQAFPRQRLVFFGLRSLERAVVPGERVSFVPQTGAMAKPAAFIRWLLLGLARSRLVGEARELRDGTRPRLSVRRGLLPVTLMHPAHFQHATFERIIAPTFALRTSMQARARAWLHSRTGGAHALFVHLRRGDYLSFPSPDAPAVVDDDWLLAALADLRRERPGMPVVLCSDDMRYASALLASEPGVVPCDLDEVDTLAVMSACEGGVLSASSFSWWAAFLARRRLAGEGREGRFIAPRYWVGHRQGRWYPEGFEFSWIEYR